jgi:hypothetical protein
MQFIYSGITKRATPKGNVIKIREKDLEQGAKAEKRTALALAFIGTGKKRAAQISREKLCLVIRNYDIL